MNKLLFSTVAMCCGLWLAACSSGTPQAPAADPVTEPGMESNRQSGISRLQPSHSEDTARLRGTLYHYSIDRRPDSSLAIVKDEQGVAFSDNSITLVICRGTAEVLRKRFTKADFSAYMDEGFRRNGILEGLVFDHATTDGFRFAASVCYPQSDLYIPLLVTVSANGQVNIRKDEMLDLSTEDFDDEGV